MVQEIAVRQALPQCLRGSFEFVVKMAFLDWEAAVLPLNYARESKTWLVLTFRFSCHFVATSSRRSWLAPILYHSKSRIQTVLGLPVRGASSISNTGDTGDASPVD